MAKAIHVECSECGNASTISTKSKEAVAFCPLCGAAVLVPYDEDFEEPFEDEDDD